MFYTLTANPAVDMTVQSTPLIPNENVRTGGASFDGNGVRTMRCGYRLRHPSRQQCRHGGYTGPKKQSSHTHILRRQG